MLSENTEAAQSTPNPVEIAKRSSGYTAFMLISAIIIGYGFLAIFLIPTLHPLRLPFIYFAPVILICGTLTTFLFYRQATGKVHRWLFITGSVIVFGGAIIDMGATFIITPDLQLEANLIVRALLDSGHSLTFVYVFGIFGQLLFQLLTCVLWTAYLRHYSNLRALIFNSSPRSTMEFIKNMLGGEGLTWRQALFSRRVNFASVSRSSYYTILVLTPIAVFMDLYRWYLGFLYLGWLPRIPDIIVILGIVILPLVLQVAWLRREYRQYLTKPS